jgi:outer membrane protein assembly factor BamE (lipoprotein component of BamABCDE complex)
VLHFQRNLIIGGALAGAAIAAIASYNPHIRSAGDAMFYTLFLHEDATTFSPGYSAAAFDRVRIGATQSEVIALLGEPLVKHASGNPHDQEVWRYTTAPFKENYWFRIIVFDKNGVVIKKEAKYFVG